jgi:endonuclease/exonuclease/phosphatase family metal-dependent hydrolase
MTQVKSFILKIVSYVTIAATVFSQIGYSLRLERDIYPKAENAVRVMSFNVLCEGKNENGMQNRLGIVTQTITEYYPDSLGVQEATPLWMLWLNLFLPEYDYVGVGRDDGKLSGEFSAIFYLKEKYKVVDSGTFWISETPDVPSIGWDADCRRVCTWAVLENKTTGARYAHLNTHLDYKGVMPRQRGVEMILEKAAEFDDLPVVVTGDFNFAQGSGYYNQLTAGVLQDTKFLAPDTMDYATFHGFAQTVNPDKVIDFVLANSRMTPLVYKVVIEGIDGRAVSDHYPLYADMLLNAN